MIGKTNCWTCEKKQKVRDLPVSYTHLDVYKRQVERLAYENNREHKLLYLFEPYKQTFFISLSLKKYIFNSVLLQIGVYYNGHSYRRIPKYPEKYLLVRRTVSEYKMLLQSKY